MSHPLPLSLPQDTPEQQELQIALEKAVSLFNAGQFWHCHEVLEQVWLRQNDEEIRTFLKGIIQAAAAFHKGTVEHNPRGIGRNLTKALDKLIHYQPVYLGLEMREFVASLHHCRAIAGVLVEQQKTDFDRTLIPPLRWSSK